MIFFLQKGYAPVKGGDFMANPIPAAAGKLLAAILEVVLDKR